MKPFSKSDTLSEFSSLERRDNKFEGGELENAAVSRIFDLAFVYIRGDLVYSVFAFQVVSRVRRFRFRIKAETKGPIEKEQRKRETKAESEKERKRQKQTKRKKENGEWETDSGYLAYTVVSHRVSSWGFVFE